MRDKIQDLVLQLWVWLGFKVLGYSHISIYVPNEKKLGDDAEVVAITFSTNEEYIDRMSEFMDELESEEGHPDEPER
ncbi:MAG: hypothetical protein ACXABY_19175 [Candidatus Thorarchaeota archaeon]